MATTVTSANAASGPTAVQAKIASLRADLRAGTIGAKTGVLDICAANHLHCNAQVLTTSKTSHTQLVFGSPIGYGATDLEKAYGLTKASSTTGTIAILDAGAYPNLESDLTIYRDTYGLPRCTTANGCLKIRNYKGGAALQPSTDPFTSFVEEEVSVETALDVQMASAACPACKIVELQLPPLDAAAFTQATTDTAVDDFGIATKTAVKLGASAVSISYGYQTDEFTDTGAPAKALTQPGVAVVASSGDSGFSEGFAQWPQNLRTVISVGGTSLYSSKTARGFSEVAWGGAGSGCDFTTAPANGQPSKVSSACSGFRAGSDISAVADPNTGVAVYDSYAPATGFPAGFIVVGGTSVASPFIAGMYARAGVPKTVLGPNAVYRVAASQIHDVTLGENAPPGACQQIAFDARVCNAGPSWDGPSGVGTPNGLGVFQIVPPAAAGAKAPVGAPKTAGTPPL